MNILCEEDCGPVAHEAGQPSGDMAKTRFELFFEQMKNLSENHTEVISGFLFACFSLIMASTVHKALIPMPKFAQEYLNFMSLKKKVWNGDMGMDRILLRGMV